MITIEEWISNGAEWIDALIPADKQVGDSYDAHDGVHWWLELGISTQDEECVTAWTYGLCGIAYPLHPEWVAMGRADREVLPLELVNWLIGVL